MDRRRKNVVIVLAVGSLVLGWRLYVLVTDYWPTSAEARPGFLGASAGSPGGGNKNEDNETWAAQALVADQPWGRDPFSDVPWAWRPPSTSGSANAAGSAPPQAPELRFTGVSRSGEQWLAAIGGQIARVGDVVGDQYEVVGIDARSVTLARGGWSITYTLGSADVTFNRRMENQ